MILVSVTFVVVTLVLTTSGFGGRGQRILTVYAKMTSASFEDPKRENFEENENFTKVNMSYHTKDTQLVKHELKRTEYVKLVNTYSIQSGGYPLEKAQAEIQTELSVSRRYGQMVVGYLLTQQVQQKEEIRETALSEIAEVKQQILMEAKKAEEAVAFKNATGISYSADDYQVLLKIVQAEAGICDAKGKILVANVILNRVRSKEFPNTIRKVVYQPSQFSPVSNGTIDSCTVTSETIECVRRALAGEDYSQGALYFMNRRAARSGSAKWFDGKLDYLFRHGGHEFFK